MFPEIENKNQQQMRAYRDMRDADLFDVQWVSVRLGEEDFPGYRGSRRLCAVCGEGINYERHVERDGRVLCRSCAGERYYEPVAAATQ
jgi:formylmethanofuran dehydrogenase subunit E